ncbi:Eukaryotic translation initiation factor 2 subunit beta [Diplonema papillatum]|nr:Eukaryotic translation initiation factor 2 subunit beta [Diplonema papillatum]
MSSDEEVELSMKKKKKKAVKKKVESDSEDEGGVASPAPVVEEEETKEQEPVQAQEAAPEIDSDEMTLEDFYSSLKAKKKKKKSAHDAPTLGGVVDWDAFQNNDRDYTYPEILSRVYERIKANNPTYGTKTVYKIRPPNVQRDGTKKVAFTNFAEICKSLNRPQDHLFNFTLTELGTSGNIDGNNCLILKGRLNVKHIEGLLRKYIEAYVTCNMCHSVDTKLVKDPHSRLTTLHCNQCNASRTVQSITGGFSAQIGRRRRA